MSSTPSSSSLGKRAIAVLILAIAAYVLFKIVLGFLMAVGTVLLVIVVVIAVIWAFRTL